MSRAVIANLQSFLDRWPGELLGDGFDGDADNIREAIAEIRRLDRLTSPAHTSEARDAGETCRFFASGPEGYFYSKTLFDAETLISRSGLIGADEWNVTDLQGGRNESR